MVAVAAAGLPAAEFEVIDADAADALAAADAVEVIEHARSGGNAGGPLPGAFDLLLTQR